MNSTANAPGEEATAERERLDKYAAKVRSHAADAEHSGNHELGHMLNNNLVKMLNTAKKMPANLTRET